MRSLLTYSAFISVPVLFEGDGGKINGKFQGCLCILPLEDRNPMAPSRRSKRKREEEDDEYEEEEEHEVEEIRGKKGKGRNLKYLIKWKNHVKCTWEPSKYLNCHDLLDEFNNRSSKKTSTPVTSAPSSSPQASETTQSSVKDAVAVVAVVPPPEKSLPPVKEPTPSSVKAKAHYCPVCDETDEAATRRCERCNTTMHHFCSHTVARGVGLDDFGDKCFCSAACYDPSKGGDHEGEPECEEATDAKEAREPDRDADSCDQKQKQDDTRVMEWVQDRKYKGKKSQYLVKWKDEDELSWEKI